ncbi:MFS transporter, partial [Kibdelosporangium lantanae]
MAERYTWNQRTLILLLCALICIAYLDRVAISYALVPAADEFGLTPTQQGVILSAFSWGYVAAMIPGGLLADRV